jgi:hypothetical protein
MLDGNNDYGKKAKTKRVLVLMVDIDLKDMIKIVSVNETVARQRSGVPSKMQARLFYLKGQFGAWSPPRQPQWQHWGPLLWTRRSPDSSQTRSA